MITKGVRRIVENSPEFLVHSHRRRRRTGKGGELEEREKKKKKGKKSEGIKKSETFTSIEPKCLFGGSGVVCRKVGSSPFQMMHLILCFACHSSLFCRCWIVVAVEGAIRHFGSRMNRIFV